MENWSTLTDTQLEKLNNDSIFSYIDKSPLDSLHRKFLKYILGVNKSSPNLAIYGNTGEVPLTIKGFTLMVNFWHHLTNLPESSLAKLALKENIENRTNWIKTVEKILCSFNLTEYTDSYRFKLLSEENGKKFYGSKWEDSILLNIPA